MGTSFNSITSLVQGLTIGDHAYSGNSQFYFPQEDIRGLDQLVRSIALRARSVEALIGDANNPSSPSAEEVCLLYSQLKKLTQITLNLRTTIDHLSESTESSVFRHLTSLGSQHTFTNAGRSPIQKLVSHFESRIKDIVREVLKNTSAQHVLWKAAEECYKQAISHSGNLHADNYFDPLEEACLGWPYDPDFDSEEYYEHEDRLLMDDDYASVFQIEVDRRFDARMEERQGWVDFWINTLHTMPNGPTLFYPPLSLHIKHLDLDVPKYLFRTFDAASSGRNDETVIVSIANLVRPQESDRVDILSREKQEAAKMLHMHLDKSCFGGDDEDDLMSWTSSLPYAIQYAVWRAHICRRHPSEISICAIDTNKFPLGQFVRDIPLIEAYKEAGDQMDGSTLQFFNFRLNTGDYYNGEYLSQGVVNHSGRSCMTSLERLIQAGLFQLYPEFGNAEGRKTWAKRVKELRQIWSTEQDTTEREIQLALQVARRCFAQFGRIDIASILLSFKCRRYSNLIAPVQSNLRQPKWANKPEEVHRHWITSEAVKSYSKLPETQFWMGSQLHGEVLRGIFS